jgi:hypothetical protein
MVRALYPGAGEEKEREREDMDQEDEEDEEEEGDMDQEEAISRKRSASASPEEPNMSKKPQTEHLVEGNQDADENDKDADMGGQEEP